MKKIYIIALTMFTLTNTSIAGIGGGQHSHKSQHWESPTYAKETINPTIVNKQSVSKGRAIFMNSCASCHGFKADGNGPLAKVLSPKPSNLRMMSKMHPDGDFAWKIANGRGAMPAWKDKIKQKDIWDIVNYIQSLSLIQLTKTESPHDHADQHGH